jgi:tyrosyl-tRNA synthetase
MLTLNYKIINNKDFYNSLNIIDFLRDIGCNLRMGQLLSRDIVRTRMASEEGFSLTEFMYQSFQAYDFYKLNRDYNVKLQLGGNDQWGNMLAGLELINRLNNKSSILNEIMNDLPADSNESKSSTLKNDKSPSFAMNITHPLITTQCGKKLGKTEGNAIDICSDNPNSMYQYIYNMADSDLELLFYQFTFLSSEEISEVLTKHLETPELRLGQKKLAESILTKYCDQEKVDQCAYISNNFHVKELNDEFFIRSSKIVVQKKKCEGLTLSKFCLDHNLVPSKSHLKRLLEAKSVKLNNNIVTEDKVLDTSKDLFQGKYLLIQTGKTKKHIFHFTDNIPE